MDLKAAPSATLEPTLQLAWGRPAHYTQICLKRSHARAHLRGEFGTCLALRQSIRCHTHVVPNEKSLLPQTVPLRASSPSTAPLPNHPNTHIISTCPTKKLCNLQHPCVRSTAICTRVPASFASHVFAHHFSYAPPSQHNPLHSPLGQHNASPSKRP